MIKLDFGNMYSRHNRHFSFGISFPLFLYSQMESGLTKNMPHTSGALKWAKMLRDRIQTPWEKFRLLFGMSVKTPYCL